MTYTLPGLVYDYSALEPYIDARTMEIHHTKHHAGYVNNLNKLLEGAKSLEKLTLEEIILDIRLVPEEIRQGVRNNGGGHLNHSLFWHIMGPTGRGEPAGELAAAIAGQFGSFGDFQRRLSGAAMGRFGSGWAWLVLDDHGKLQIIDTPNQDSPVMLGYKPVLGLDIWEHAYYLQYQNRRDYIDAWWNVVNWRNVESLYLHTLQSLQRVAHSKDSSKT